MEWIEGKITRSSSVNFGITLYRVDEDIYDEITFKNGEYFLIRRCGTKKYIENHGFNKYIVDGDILIYPLENHEIYEEQIDGDFLKTFSEVTVISLNNNKYVKNKFTLDTNKKYIEYSNLYTGNDINIDTSKYDENRKSYIYKIKNMFPHELLDNDLIVEDTFYPTFEINGNTQQIVTYDDDVLISPTINSPSNINSLGTFNTRENVYDISLHGFKNDNKWHCVQYNKCGTTLESLEDGIKNREFDFDDKDFSIANSFLNNIAGAFVDNYTLHAFCYVFVKSDVIFETTFRADDIGNLYVNNELICTSNVKEVPISIHFTKGLNRVDVVLQDIGGYNGFIFENKFSEQSFVSALGFNVDLKNIYFKAKSPIKLQCIGDVKDNFFFDKSDKLWKIKQNIGEYVFDGTEEWSMSVVSSNRNKFTYTSNLFSSNTTQDSINVISNRFLGVNNAQNLYEISIVGNELNCILPSKEFPSVESFVNFLKNNQTEIRYILENTIDHEVKNQYIYNNFCKKTSVRSFCDTFGCLIQLNSMQGQLNHYKTYIRVYEGKTYKFKRPKAGENCFLEYYDEDKNLISFSENFQSDLLEITFEIPENIYYISFFDTLSSENDAYSLMESSELKNENTEISTLQLTKNNTTHTFTLPHTLNPGDELEYNIDKKCWTYYPLSIDDDFIYYYDAKLGELLLEQEDIRISCQNGLYITAVLASITVRDLTYPENVQVVDDAYTGDNGYGYITWDELPGATNYDLYIDKQIVASVENTVDKNEYHCDKEQYGKVSIVGYNNLVRSDYSDEVNICTVPNSPLLELVDTVYENNRYSITIKFIANSSIADSYDIIYSIDGSKNKIVSFPHNKVYGEEIVYTFNSPLISKNITLQLISSNITGRNDYEDKKVLVTNSGFSVWTYKTNMNEVLLGWIDDFIDETSYSLKYSVDNGEWNSLIVDGKSGSGERLIEYLPLNQTSEMRVCIAVIKDGLTNVYSRPITVSKKLDKTLIPPANFMGTKVDSGKIQFTWEDSYDVDAEFELYYQYSDGSSQTIYIPKESSTTGNYTYVHNVDVYGFATARLRMIWELGESEYTENIIVYNIPVVDEAPPLLPRQREHNKLKISWQSYEFVKNYVLYFTVNGVQKIIEQVDSEYLWDIPYDTEFNSINIAVKAVFIDGSYTNISESLSFNICNHDYHMNSLIYTHSDFEKNLYTIVGSKQLTNYYPIYTISMNSYITPYHLIERTYSAYLFSEYNLVENYWGHGVGESYSVWTTLCNSFLFDYPIIDVIYSEIEIDNPLETTVYVPTTVEYPLYSEFIKVAIVCLGDSITAGHPNYWE